jgi:hypothetical protein
LACIIPSPKFKTPAERFGADGRSFAIHSSGTEKQVFIE